MFVWRGCAEVPEDLMPTSVTIGAFDGVHRGHRVLLERTVAEARDVLMPVAVTFDPHPLTVIRPPLAPLLLTSVAHRLELFEELGLGGVLVLPFTAELAAQTPQQFAASVLAETLHASRVVVGRNFRFGHRAAGDVHVLSELGRGLGFDTTILDLAPFPVDAQSNGGGAAAAVSSTVIRALIAQGDVSAAAAALHRAHRVSGPVVRGDRRGRQLGYPTANVDVDPTMAIPADGVYAARIRVRTQPGLWRPAAVSVGSNPTFDGQERRVEAYVLDAPDVYDIYGAWADVEFVERLRGMRRFDSADELRAVMADDVARSHRVLVGPEST